LEQDNQVTLNISNSSFITTIPQNPGVQCNHL